MAHKTLIDGTAYEISGGKTLVDGTAYEIDKGKTLVDGTVYEVVYEVGFASDAVLTINTTSGILASPNYAEITIVGYGTYVGDATATYELIVPVGTEIECTIRAENTPLNRGIVVNEVQVATINYPDITEARYTYIVNSNATINMGAMYYSGTIEITDANFEPESTQ